MTMLKTHNYFLKTFGCQMNKLDSIYIQLLLNDFFFQTHNIHKTQIIILNTCSIKETSENKILSFLNNIHKKQTTAKNIFIGIVGCFVERLHYNFMIKYNFVDCFIGPSYLYFLPHILKLFSLNLLSKQLIYRNNNNNHFIAEVQKKTDFLEDVAIRHKKKEAPRKLREYIRIMKGCNKFCSYCVVPHTRGFEIYRSLEQIIVDIKVALMLNVQEIILLGQSVNHYYYKDVNFYKLLYIISKIVPKTINIKFFTSYPKNIVYPLLSIMNNKDCLAKYLHMPIQSGSNFILRKMNRYYTKEEYLDIIKTAYNKIPYISIAGDIIVGFPNETSRDFKESVQLLYEVKYKHLFIAQYSPRPKTISHMHFNDNVSKTTKIARHNYILKVQQHVMIKENSLLMSKKIYGYVFQIYHDIFYNNKAIMLVKTIAEKIIFIFDNKNFLGKNIWVKITKIDKLKIFGVIL